MELEHGVAQLVDRLCERLVGAAQRGVGTRLGDVLELVPGGEEVLERVVVQRLGERPPLALLRGQRLGEQPRAARRESRDELGAPREHQREDEAGEPDPGEEAGLCEDEPSRSRLVRRRVRERLADVGGRRHDRRDAGHGRPEAERDRHRYEEEREPHMRERAAGEQRERRERDHVDARRRERELRADGPDVHPDERGQAPRGEEREHDREAAVRVRRLDPLAERDERDRREAEPRDDSLGLCGRFTGDRGSDPAAHDHLDQAPLHIAGADHPTRDSSPRSTGRTTPRRRRVGQGGRDDDPGR